MDFSALRINADRLRKDFEELAGIGATLGGGVSRLALSNEDLEARAWFANRLDEAGLIVRDDDAGNLSGVLMCGPDDARVLILGSHLDTVPNAGLYDGSIGVLAALECVRTIKECGIHLPLHLEVINFTDEEGCWHSLFGSKALTGMLKPAALAVSEDGDIGAFRAALFRAGIRPADVHKAARDMNKIAGYLELHIEQGCKLDKQGLPVGIVSAIVGRTTHQLTFYGEAGHSGTTENENRRDALYGASLFINRAHQMIREKQPDGVFNCGNIIVKPGSFNIIPQSAALIIETRHPDEQTLSAMESSLIRLAHECAQQHKLTVGIRRIVHMPAASMAAEAVEAIESACEQVKAAQCMQLVSYSGHDAQILSQFTRTGMILVPSVSGISHHPKEFTNWDDIVTGANVLLHAALNMAAAS